MDRSKTIDVAAGERDIQGAQTEEEVIARLGEPTMRVQATINGVKRVDLMYVDDQDEELSLHILLKDGVVDSIDVERQSVQTSSP